MKKVFSFKKYYLIYLLIILSLIFIIGCDQNNNPNPPENMIGECESDLDCSTGGCSSQICGPKDSVDEIITTCEFKPEYECLQKTSCGCVNGKCMWRENEAYLKCLGEIQ